MIISHKHQFIFIHNYKVAGTSIRKALKPFADNSLFAFLYNNCDKLVFDNFPIIYSKQFYGHDTIVEVKKKLPPHIFNAYYKFGFVRNPWSWQVSLYHYAKNSKEHYQYELMNSFKNFKDYIKWRVDGNVVLQSSFFYDEKNCLVDFIGKYENLQNDFNHIKKVLQIDLQLLHLNKSAYNRDFLSFYDVESIDLIAQAFKRDIELFNYNIPQI